MTSAALANPIDHIIDLRIDVETDNEVLGRQTIAAWLLIPPSRKTNNLFVCLSGGGFSKRYFHSQFSGYRNYSFGHWMAEHGCAVLAIDHLGMGESAKPDVVEHLTKEVIARCHDRVVGEVLARMDEGEWLTQKPEHILGIGHSMGAMVLIAQQAAYSTYDGIAVLGWTNIGVTDVDTDALSFLAQNVGYLPSDRKMMRSMFHMEDVPLDVIEQDDVVAELTPSPLAIDALKPGIVANQAAQITKPVFLCFGERDISPDPDAEAAFYKSAPSVEFVRLENSAHNHNFSSVRTKLWRRLLEWAEAQEQQER